MCEIIFNIRCLREQVGNGPEIRSGIQKTVPHRALIQKCTQWMVTVESKSRILDILGDLEIPSRHIFLGPKRGHVWEKEDVWSPYVSETFPNRQSLWCCVELLTLGVLILNTTTTGTVLRDFGGCMNITETTSCQRGDWHVERHPIYLHSGKYYIGKKSLWWALPGKGETTDHNDWWQSEASSRWKTQGSPKGNRTVEIASYGITNRESTHMEH